MKKRASVTIVGVLFIVSLAQAQTNKYISKDLGISIELPTSGQSNNPGDQIAMFFLPVANGFAGNINIQRQIYSETIEAYDKLSTQQFKSINWEIISKELKKNEVVFEYKGELQGRSLHWYARAIKNGNYVYLVTATALESNWINQKEQLIKSVNTFKNE